MLTPRAAHNGNSSLPEQGAIGEAEGTAPDRGRIFGSHPADFDSERARGKAGKAFRPFQTRENRGFASGLGA